MVMKMSRLYGMDIYTDGGKFLGIVQDLILDLEKGEVVRLTMEPLQSISRDEAKRILKERSVLYKNVRSVEDVVVVSKQSAAPQQMVEEFTEKPEAGGGYSFGRLKR